MEDQNNLEKLVEPLKGTSTTDPYTDMGSHVAHSDHTFTTIRETTYMGREIRIETSYKITIDGEPFKTHVGVSNDGKVHYHGLPQYSFSSAIGMIKKIIRVFHKISLPKNELGV